MGDGDHRGCSVAPAYQSQETQGTPEYIGGLLKPWRAAAIEVPTAPRQLPRGTAIEGRTNFRDQPGAVDRHTPEPLVKDRRRLSGPQQGARIDRGRGSASQHLRRGLSLGHPSCRQAKAWQAAIEDLVRVMDLPVANQ